MTAELVSRTEIAAVYGVTDNAVDKWTRSGEFPEPRVTLTYPRGAYRRWDAAEVSAWVAEHRPARNEIERMARAMKCGRCGKPGLAECETCQATCPECEGPRLPGTEMCSPCHGGMVGL
jgi:predicted DNA-binding transcriptional regulator AlpA